MRIGRFCIDFNRESDCDDGDDDGNHHSENGCRERQGLTLR